MGKLYVIVGASAGALIGVQVVVITLIAPQTDRGRSGACWCRLCDPNYRTLRIRTERIRHVTPPATSEHKRGVSRLIVNPQGARRKYKRCGARDRRRPARPP